MIHNMHPKKRIFKSYVPVFNNKVNKDRRSSEDDNFPFTVPAACQKTFKKRIKLKVLLPFYIIVQTIKEQWTAKCDS